MKIRIPLLTAVLVPLLVLVADRASAGENQPPISDPNGPYVGLVGLPLQFDGTGSSDLDGTIVEYLWDFGDGSSGQGPTPTHIYGNEGLYTVILSVMDDGQLRDEMGTSADIRAGFIEVDTFDVTTAAVELIGPDGGSELILLSGPSTARVFFEGAEGEAGDGDGNGLDDVQTELVRLELRGDSSLGPVLLRLNPDFRSWGEMEEQQNDKPGILDVQPFAETGLVDSFFDVFFELQVGNFNFHNGKAKRLSSVISHKPPAENEFYESPEPVELLDINGGPTGFFIGASRHLPQPGPDFVEIDVFDDTTALLELVGGPLGATPVPFVLRGPAEAHVFFEGPIEGDALDDDRNGLEEVKTELVSLELTDGAVSLVLTPNRVSAGEIEELQNNTLGTLDLPPFTATGLAQSFFDVFFDIKLPDGTVLRNQKALRIEARISHKPPFARYFHLVPPDGGIQLFDEQGEPTGVFLTKAAHHTGHVEIDHFEDTAAVIELINPLRGTEVIELSGPSTAHVFFEGGEGEAGDDDGDGFDEVETELVALELTGTSSMGPVRLRLNPDVRSLGAMEERENNKPGILDVPPFAETGLVDSFFDVFFEIQVGQVVLFNGKAKRLRSVISHKPPAEQEAYENADRVELLTPQGEPSGYAIGASRHVPNPGPDFVEVDIFERTTALLQLAGEPLGPDPLSFVLRGPSEAHVFFEGPAEGDASDDDNNGLDEVDTELVALNLTDGIRSLKLNPNLASRGEMEEQVNNTPGTLDVAPFTTTGLVDSFFDVFFEIDTGTGLVLHNQKALRVAAVIDEKPPRTRYVHLVPPDGGLELFDENDRPTGIFLTKAAHHTGEVEIDHFERTTAAIELIIPDVRTEVIQLVGPSTAHVFFEGNEGEADDDDGDGLDDVETELVALNLTGNSSFGPVRLRLDPDMPSPGEMEERVNDTPGILDVPPFTATGLVNSFFDVFFEIVMPDGTVLHNVEPKRLSSVISHKPPAEQEVYESPTRIELYDESGKPTGIFIGASRHLPQPGPGVVEIDVFEQTTALLQLAGGPLGEDPVPFVLRGPSEAHVFFEGPKEGDALDDDGNGLDEVKTELVALDLSDGSVSLRLSPGSVSPGEIEERANDTLGTLDVPPFTETGNANSFFDVFFDVVLPDGTVLHNEDALRIASVINHKPPHSRYIHLVPPDGGLELYDENGRPTGVFLVRAVHHTGFVEIDHFERTVAEIEISVPGAGTELIQLVGPSTAHVFFEGGEGDAVDDDGDGRDDVETELVQLDLIGISPVFGVVRLHLNPNLPSPGEIEERVNDTPGTLDLPPFTATGSADSFFDVFFELEVGGTVLHNRDPKRLSSVITHKPPAQLEGYEGVDQIPLFNENGDPTGIVIGASRHVPDPGFIERDHFERTTAAIELIDPSGASELIQLVGPSTAHVFFEGGEGEAGDDDGDGLDDVATELVALELTGNASFGVVDLRLNPGIPSLGEMEEQVNNTPGILDVPPFTATGRVNSFFDVFFEIVLPDGTVLHNEAPKQLRSVISHKPPAEQEVYESPEEIELYDAAGNPTGYVIGASRHLPNPGPDAVEIDVFEETTALLQLAGGPLGEEPVPFVLRGSSVAHVFFEGPVEGDAQDDDGNGRDEVETELVALDLSDGSVTLRLDPSQESPGEIEELVNNTPGTLDLPPFTTSGQADSFFDVFFEIELRDGTVLHNEDALHIVSVIDHKPPRTRYVHLIPPDGGIELYDENGRPTGIFLVRAEHYTGHLEIDHFEHTQAEIEIFVPGAGPEVIRLSGPSTAHVFFEGGEGDAADDDGNGRDEVETELVQLDLVGISPVFGIVRMHLNPNIRSPGEIEERENNTPGTLDLPPFTATGLANSFFDVFFELEVAGQVLHNREPKRLSSVISHKPPGQLEGYEGIDQIRLFDANGEPTEIVIGASRHVPNPGFIERDHFERTTAAIELIDPSGASELIQLVGPSTAHVFFEGGEGEAGDDDGDGLDDVATELVALELTGNASFGVVGLRLNPGIPSLGEMEEQVNNTPGILDVPPFTATGRVNSFFDVFFEIVLPDGTVLHNQDPKRLRSVISHKPPAEQDSYENLEDIELYDADGKPTGFFVGASRHRPNPGPGVVEVDVFEETTALLQLAGGPLGDEPVPFVLRGPSVAHVFFEGPNEGDALDDDGNGLDEVETELVSLDLSDGTVTLRLDPSQPSPGQIEEQVNNIFGTLDLAPFAPGLADSFFDVFFEIVLADGTVLHNEDALRIVSIINEKPPISRYIHVVPPDGGIELFDENGRPTGIFLVRAEHYTGHVEIDHFERTTAAIELIDPSGASELIQLFGPSTAQVFFERGEGEAADDDGNSLDEVETELVELNLFGNSSFGPVRLRLNPEVPSLGEMEEQVNDTPGILDVQPFTETGLVDSFFDVFFEIVLADGTVLHNEDPKRLSSVISHKPPAEQESYENLDEIELYDANGNATGYVIGASRHRPNPGTVEPEIDIFEDSTALLQLAGGLLGEEPVSFVLRGPSEAHVFFEGPNEGDASDDDGNGLEEVETELVSLDLTNGSVTLRLDPSQPSPGQIEELVNNIFGTLDVDPFAPGRAESFFDVFFEIELPDGTVLHNEDALRIVSIINHKPPHSRYIHLIPPDGGLELYDEQGRPTGIFLVRAVHHTGHVEIDHFERTTAAIELIDPSGASELIQLVGPSTAHVFFERDEGEAVDDDGDGLDEVETELVALSLIGNSSFGPVRLRLNPEVPSLGEMEEQVNDTPGTLDVQPFTATGLVDSFFDVFFEIELPDGTVLHNEDPKRLSSVISHKPPAEMEGYENREPIQLYDAGGEPTGYSIGVSRHVPNPGFIEVDHFERTVAEIELIVPGAAPELIQLSGPSTAHVFFEGGEGEAGDDDGNGRDDVDTELVALSLTGSSPTYGPVRLDLSPSIPSLGEMEERANNTPGTLDVRPFTETGRADSFFDVFFELRVGGQVLHNEQPKRLRSLISHKPPAVPDWYENREPIELYDAQGRPTGFVIGASRHVPNPPPGAIEVDHFERTTASINLVAPNGTAETILMVGPSTAHVFFEGPTEGDADDDDGDGFDEVDTQLVELDLVGNSSLGTLHMRLNPSIPSVGGMTERTNATPGTLDVRPFTATGEVDSFFEVFFEIVLPDGTVLHNEEAKRLSSRITHKPPAELEGYEGLDEIELYDEQNRPTGYVIAASQHLPDPGPGAIEVDVLEQTTALLQLEGEQLGPDPVSFVLRGSSEAHVFFEGPNEGDALDDDGNGWDEVKTELVSLDLTDGTVSLRLDPSQESPGQIEELVNNTFGTLDVPPFTTTGQAESFFDVFFEIELPDGAVLHNEDALRIVSIIDYKPPHSRYIHLVPPDGGIELYDEQGRPTGIFLVRAVHHTGYVEIDHFEHTKAAIELIAPTGETELIQLVGPSTAHVFFESDEGEAVDDDGNSLDEVETELVALDLHGDASFGPLHLRLSPDRPSPGEMEERENNTPGTLDVQPFTETGLVDSFFDVFFEIVLPDGTVLHNEVPKRLSSVISHKPPAEQEAYESPTRIELYDDNGNPTGFSIGASRHLPNPGPIERDVFEDSTVLLELVGGPLGDEPLPFLLRGPAEAHVFFEGSDEGDALDDDGNGRDEVETELVSLDLRSGAVSLRLDPIRPSLGETEELVNNTPGTLDVRPFAPFGQAFSFFDVFFEVDLGEGLVLHNERPLRIAAVISHKPPFTLFLHLPGDSEVELYDELGEPTGIFVARGKFHPGFVERDDSERSSVTIDLILPDGETERIPLSGPSTTIVFFEGTEGSAEDGDGDGRDEVESELVSLELRGESSFGPVRLGLSEFHSSMGEIEERRNDTPGLLDVAPFSDTGGVADSFFDIFVELELGDNEFLGGQPIRLSGAISHKPPTGREPFTSEVGTELLYPNGDPSGVYIGPIDDFFFIPEPDGGLLVAAALLTLVALRRRREARTGA